MAKVKRDEFKKGKPKITQDDMDGDVVVLTVARADIIDTDDEGVKRKAMVLEFEEFPDLCHWPNQTQIGYIVDQYGDETDDWLGQPLPLEKHTSRFTGKDFEVVWVAPPKDWESLFKDAGVRAPLKVGKRTVAAPEPVKRTKRARGR